MTDDMMTIRQMCDAFDVTPRTLRFYESRELLSPLRRGQHRLYDRRDRSGRIIESVDLLAGVQLPDVFDSWSWTVAPFGEEAEDEERVHRVVTVEDEAVDL